MKQGFSYLVALFLGLFVGWLGQQFWLGSNVIEPSTSQSLSRQYQRLNNLKERSSFQPQVVEQTDIVDPLPSKYQQAIESKDIEQALDYFSQLENSSIDDVLVLAALLYEKERYEFLFSFLYDKRYGLDTKTEQALLSEIYLLVEKVDVKLGAENEYDRLVNLYRQLSSLEADHTFYYLRLAYWLLLSGNTQEASQSLLGVVNDIELEAQLRDLQDAIEQYDEIGPKIEVPLTMVGEHYLVNINVAGAVNLELMIDTGASKTVIKRTLFGNSIPDLLHDVRDIQMNTANGNVRGFLVKLKSFAMSGLELEQLEVVLMDLPDFKHDGLLGMNFLGQFDFKIDQENQVLILTAKKPVQVSVRK